MSRKQRYELARKRAAWNDHFHTQDNIDGENEQKSKLKGVTEFSGRKYMLRRESKTGKHHNGEVWDEELKMFYGKRYDKS